MNRLSAGLFLLLCLVLACAPEGAGRAGTSPGSVEHEKYELPNGLDVVLHIDRSDPVAAVALTFHVGSAPWGHSRHVIDRALYPDGHPYRWQVIGSLADLGAATLPDVKEFHGRWYGPNSATLVVAGDIDVARRRRGSRSTSPRSRRDRCPT